MKHLYCDTLTFRNATSSFCQTSLRSMPKHFPNAAFFIRHCLRKPLSQLMQAASREVSGDVVVVGGRNPLPQVESVEQSIDSSRRFFILIAAPPRLSCLLSTSLHHSAQQKKKTHFLCSISLKLYLAISLAAALIAALPICIYQIQIRI